MERFKPHTREHHYWTDSGRSEFWEYNSLLGWHLIDDEYPDWGRWDYNYYSWREIDGAIAAKGMPPRIFI